MNQEEKISTEYDEIDLMDYVKVIIKRKWLILTIFLGSAIAAGVFSFIMPKVYKIDTSLEIGTVAEGTVEDPTQVKEKIDGDVYGIFVREKLEIPKEKYPKIKIENPKNTRLMNIKIESSETEKAKDVLEEINNLILAEHQKEIKVKIDLINQNIKTTEEKIKLTESDIEKIVNKIKITESDIEKTKNKIKPLESDIERVKNKIEYAGEEKENLEAKVEALEKVLVYEQTPGTQFALFDAKEKLANKKQEIENLYSRINSLKIEIENQNLTINSLERTKDDYNSQINSLRTNIESLNSQINSLRASLDDVKPTKVLKSPTISERPVKPNKKLNIAIAGILGLFVGVFLAFGKEWWEKSRL